MPRIVFTAHLIRHVGAPTCTVSGDTVRAALEDAFAQHTAVRGYVLDDQGHLRRHVVIFVDGSRIQDRETLSDPVHPNSELYVLQALTGG